METLYFVGWVEKSTPSVSGHGAPLSKSDAEFWAYKANKEYPTIEHRVITVFCCEDFRFARWRN